MLNLQLFTQKHMFLLEEVKNHHISLTKSSFFCYNISTIKMFRVSNIWIKGLPTYKSPKATRILETNDILLARRLAIGLKQKLSTFYSFLVGGFNPIWKILVKLVNLPPNRGEHKNLWNHQPVHVCSELGPMVIMFLGCTSRSTQLDLWILTRRQFHL